MLVLIQVLLQVLSNVWYTGGWLVELIVRAVARGNIPWFGPMALAAGTLFSFAFAAYFLFLFLLFSGTFGILEAVLHFPAARESS